MMLACFNSFGSFYVESVNLEDPQILTVLLNLLQVNWLRVQALQNVCKICFSMTRSWSLVELRSALAAENFSFDFVEDIRVRLVQL